ncbi:hypothetical protein VHEMI05803 [[Torrubiella] hemipterigena]|uniref:Efficient mitochondria targeting-associated protein 19 n=1 Tax=[Torrubiella] hemipterigena TaxID=1531966 RepID=A0A0A1THJ4_9HYPO|nr:hypothetical protein VHEMI05803 [[Torrubiella] hemipterigena]
MATQKRAIDWLYFGIVLTMTLGMLVLDLRYFYPESLWKAPTAPLHFLVTIRNKYVATTGDPLFALGHEPWFESFIWIEGLVQLPMGVYIVYSLMSGKPTTPAVELIFLIFGSITCMGSVACCAHIAQTPASILDASKKASLVYGTYLPFALIPAAMVVDMHQRLLARFAAMDAQLKEKKAQ